MRQSIFVPSGFPQQRLWEELLGEWLRLLKRFEEVPNSKPDIAYWYGERSLTGLLSAAAWSLEGGWSLEEFGAERGDKSDKQYGRGDLWVGCVHGKATVEAKLVWAVQSSVDSVINEIDKQLGLADEQLRSLEKEYRVDQLAAVCFVVPWYASPEGTKLGEQKLRELEDQAIAKKWAYAKHLSDKVVSCGDGYDYPGVSLVARHCKMERGN